MKGLGNDSLIKKCLNPGSHWNPGRGAGGHSHFFGIFASIFAILRVCAQMGGQKKTTYSDCF